MVDVNDQTFVDVGMALLRATAGLTVYPDANGVTPNAPTPPYVRVYANVERTPAQPGNPLSGESSTAMVRWYCTCVGGNEIAVRAVAALVRASLLDINPGIPGFSAGTIRQETSNPPRLDTDAGYQILYQTDVYYLRVYG